MNKVRQFDPLKTNKLITIITPSGNFSYKGPDIDYLRTVVINYDLVDERGIYLIGYKYGKN